MLLLPTLLVLGIFPDVVFLFVVKNKGVCTGDRPKGSTPIKSTDDVTFCIRVDTKKPKCNLKSIHYGSVKGKMDKCARDSRNYFLECPCADRNTTKCLRTITDNFKKLPDGTPCKVDLLRDLEAELKNATSPSKEKQIAQTTLSTKAGKVSGTTAKTKKPAKTTQAKTITKPTKATTAKPVKTTKKAIMKTKKSTTTMKKTTKSKLIIIEKQTMPTIPEPSAEGELTTVTDLPKTETRASTERAKAKVTGESTTATLALVQPTLQMTTGVATTTSTTKATTTLPTTKATLITSMTAKTTYPTTLTTAQTNATVHTMVSSTTDGQIILPIFAGRESIEETKKSIMRRASVSLLILNAFMILLLICQLKLISSLRAAYRRHYEKCRRETAAQPKKGQRASTSSTTSEEAVGQRGKDKDKKQSKEPAKQKLESKEKLQPLLLRSSPLRTCRSDMTVDLYIGGAVGGAVAGQPQQNAQKNENQEKPKPDILKILATPQNVPASRDVTVDFYAGNRAALNLIPANVVKQTDVVKNPAKKK